MAKRARTSVSLADKCSLLTKADAVQDPAPGERVRDYATREGLPCLRISAVTGEGIQELIRVVAARLDELVPDGAAGDR